MILPELTVTPEAQNILSTLLTPRNLIILTIVFLAVYWILSTLKFITSIAVKILIALLIVTVIAFLLGINLNLSIPS